MPYLGQRPSKGDENNFKILDDISSYTLTFDGSDSSVVSAANDTITSLTHRFVQGQRVTYNKGGGTVITGLSDGVYYIIKEDHNTIKLATSASNASNGVAVNITGVGAGSSHTLNVAFDGINTKFKATHTNGQKARITRSAQLVISINGVIQQPHDTATPSTGFGFDLDGTIVFSQAPVSTDEYWAHVLTNNNVTFDISNNDIDNFTGDGSTTEFNLSKTPPDNRNILVTIDGVVQYPNDPDGTARAYVVVENVLTFNTAPDSGVEIQVRHIGFAGSTSDGSGVTNFYGRTGSVVLKNTDNITVNDAAITGDATVTGNLTINGDFTTLNTTLREVELLRVDANDDNVAAGIITQTGTGDILNLYDGSSEVFSVADGGSTYISNALTINRTTGLSGAKLSITKIADQEGIGIQLNQNTGITTSLTTFNSAGQQIFDLAHDTDTTPDLIFKLKHTDTGAPAEKLRIKSNGYVGINTTGLYPLDVLEPTDNAGLISITGKNTGYDTGFLIRNGSSPKWYLINDVNGSGGHSFEIRGDGWSSDRFLTLTQAGKVGIGTVTPSAKLESYQSGTTGYLFRAMAGLSVGNRAYDLKPPSSDSLTEPFSWNTPNAHAFQVDGIERLRITSGGNVNIGIASDVLSQTTFKAQIETATNKLISFGAAEHDDLSDEGAGIIFSRPSDGSTKISGIFQHSNQSLGMASRGGLTFHVGGTSFYSAADERVRIDSDGRLLVGLTSDPAESSIVAEGNSVSGTSYAVLDLRRGQAATASGDVCGYIRFSDTNISNTNNNYAWISGTCDGVSGGAGDNPGRLVFATCPDNGTGLQERMHILNGGSVNIGGNYTQTTTKFHVEGKASIKDTGGDVLKLESTTNTSRTTLKFVTDGNDWEIGARGSAGEPNNAFYIYDNAASEYRTVINPSGRVGLGTEDPGAPVHMRADANNMLMLESTDRHSTMYLIDSIGSSFIQNDSGELRFGVGGTGGTAGGETEAVRIDSDGKVGVGTHNPSTEFHVHDGNSVLVALFESKTHDSRVRIKAPDGKLSQLEFADDDADAGEIRYDHDTDKMTFHVRANNEKLGITSTGQVKITGSDDQDNFIVDAAQTQFKIHQDSTDGEISLRAEDGSGNNYAKYMTFFIEGGSGSTERLRITSNGSIGAGTTANIDERVHFEHDANITMLVETTATGSGANAALRLKSAESSSDWYVQTGHAASGGLRFYGGNEKVRITTKGTTVSGGTIPSDTTTYSSSFRGREGVISPIYYWPRSYGNHSNGGGYDNVAEGGRLTLRMVGAQGGTSSMFQGGFGVTYGGGGEGIEYNRVRVIFRATRDGTTDGYTANSITFKMQSYYYSGGWTDISGSSWNFTGTDSERGYRWTASNWISSSDFAGGFDVPSIAIKYDTDNGNLSNANIRIAAVYLQYARFS